MHQFVRLGRLSIIGGCSKVVQDIPPFSMCDGHPARVYSLNIVGLKRAKLAAATIRALKAAFKIFNSGLSKPMPSNRSSKRFLLPGIGSPDFFRQDDQTRTVQLRRRDGFRNDRPHRR